MIALIMFYGIATLIHFTYIARLIAVVKIRKHIEKYKTLLWNDMELNIRCIFQKLEKR